MREPLIGRGNLTPWRDAPTQHRYRCCGLGAVEFECVSGNVIIIELKKSTGAGIRSPWIVSQHGVLP